MKKKIAITGVILFVVAYIIFNVISLAGSEIIYVGLNVAHSNGSGYGIGNPLNGGLVIWNLRNYKSVNRTEESNLKKELYCLKGLYGESWDTNTLTVVPYNLSYDLQKEREKVLNLLVDSGNGTANDVVTEILNDSTGIYKELLWVIDNIFIPGKSDKEQLLERIGIVYDEENAVYNYIPVDGYDYTDNIYMDTYTTTLTESDIKAVQQAVIWYFTNAIIDGNKTFDNRETADWLTLTLDNGSSYTQLSDYNKFQGEGPSRFWQCQILYNYLIDSATNNVDNFKSEGYEKPIEINLTGLSTDENGNYEIESNRNGTNYIAGPIKISKNNDLDYSITLKVTNTAGQTISSSNYTFTDSQGNSLGTNIKDLAGRTDGFYISVPKTVATGINIDMTVTYTTKTKTLWLSGTENSTTSITLKSEQPVLEVSEETSTESVRFTAIPKEFDLALRKYITRVNGTNVIDTRVPDISEDTLQTGTTATYKHKKDPVLVETGDIVTYKITIYNEGEKSGYATEIIDQLPTGLKYSGETTITSDKNTYKVIYNETTNKLTFAATTSTPLNKYTTNLLDSETLEFTCKVTATPDTTNDKILTNVAWISGAYDSDSNMDVTEIGDDRDSRPQTYPSVDKESMENYKGNSSNKIDLIDSTYFYQGEQDDDDFEKLLIEPKTSIIVNKTWDDNNNQDGIRPSEVTVGLYANGTALSGKTATLNETNKWTYTFTDLPLKENGTAIVYSVKETSNIEGYSTIINDFTITNTHEPETTEVSVTKVWEDNNNQDGIRPASIAVSVLANGTQKETITLNEENEWKCKFSDLPVYENGNKITYDISEVKVPNGYTSEKTGDVTNGFTITNTHEPETTEISVTKVWEDNNNQDGLRPTEITVSLLADGTNKETITLKEDNQWKHTFTDLPVYEAGSEIEYDISEVNVPEGYTSEKTGDEASGFTITNTHEPEITDISVTKVWDDNNNQDGLRPTEITVSLKADGTNKETITLKEGNRWKHTFTDLPVYQDGKEVDYGVEEVSVQGYISEITGDEATGFTITNTHEPETTEISVTKVWNDNNNQDGLRPTEITVSLIADRTNKETITLKEDNQWKHTFTNLPVYEDGTKIEYDVLEVSETEGYTSEKTGDETTGFTITNTYTPQVVDVSVTKVWDDNNNQDGLRPDSIIVKLLSNGTEKETATLNEENQWKYTFKNLPQKQGGNNITYTIEEEGNIEGYTTKTEGDMTTGFTITNSHTPEVISIPVTKKWEDNNDQDGIRPESITLTLYADNKEVEGQTITLSGVGNEWSYTFTNLPKKSNGTDIKYTVVETGIPQGYTSETIGDMTTGITITNTYTPKTIEIPVKKVWVDSDNQDGLRPTSIEIILKADGTEVQRTTLTGEGNEWSHTFSDLPEYSNGQEITYTIEEDGVPEGYTSLSSGNKTIGFTITNTYTPGETSLKVTKVWEDNNNQDGLRPEKVTVILLANDEEVQTVELSKDNNWIHTFTGLPEKANGQDITYTVQEKTTIEGYTTTITNNNVTSTAGEIQTVSAPEYIITNTHETAEISITVDKVWNDENDADKIRPASVIVNIKNGEEIVDTVTLSAENNWTHTFQNLPAKENGETINYTIEEVEPEGYTADIIDNGNNSYTITNTHAPEKLFDLALRKYITKINNNELTTLGLATRVPNIFEPTLQNGTTATYKHRKEPVAVEEGDIVTYEITIYNEGEKAGYASQIIDQLPTGLIYNPSSTITSKDADGNDKNTYTVTYEASTNKVTFDIVNTTENPVQDLEPYSAGNLDYETIEIKCKVVYTAVAGEENILTNVAWINAAHDSVENKEITDVGDDRDSEPGTKPNVNKDNMEDYKGNDSNKEDLTDNTYHYKGEQDDDDFEKLYVKTFDLSLRKFIISVNGDVTKTSREPVVDVTPLKAGTETTAIYKHPKTPVSLKVGDTVIYTIRVYNEGEIAGYANEVKDYLPPCLEYVEDSTINSRYGWTISEDGRVATSTYLSNKEISEFNGTELDYEDLQIECKVSNSAIPDENITNIAEISEYKYGDTVVPEDIDSESDNIDENLPKDEELPNYKKEQEKDEYVLGNEDDDDFEKVYVKEFDLALRKFITKVQKNEVITREPQVKYENGTISYQHPKDAITVHVGDVVIYTLRIYNEGEIDGYASEITDDIPEYLEYLPEDSTNVEYMWKMYDENGNETEDVEKAVKVKTEYLSKENGEKNLIKAFDGNTLYYKNIKIAFKIKDPNSNTYIITNHAQISDDTDLDGNEINDKDSKPDEWNEGEDDQDIENVKVEYFDLSLLKFVSKVIIQENGTEKITETGYNGYEDPEPVVKVELHKKKLDDVVVKFGYGITITNEGDIAGYATEITDYIPEGLKFDPTDNPEWTDEGNNVISTRQLEETLLQPGESATVEVILTWINGPENLALKTNTVEISEDDNEYNVPDRDSTPDNKKDGEDDIDIAKVILAITTGTAKTYFTLAIGLLTVVLVGVILIKKFVI